MKKLIIHNEKITDAAELLKVCPFGALEISDGRVVTNSACKMCGVCAKRCKNGEIEITEEKTAPAIDKSEWNGICVYVEHIAGKIHPVTLELIGKARELADKLGHKVFCLMMGTDIKDSARELLNYPVDEVFVYDRPELENFRQETYASVFENFVNRVRPSVILVGATTVGRQLAPRVAARFRTGLTADCTVLDIEENTDLVQIRPAFGGNIMAQIATPNNRPQMATVRYKVMDQAKRCEPFGKLTVFDIAPEKLKSGVDIISVEKKPVVEGIENAEIIVAAGRGCKDADLELVKKLADALGGTWACTRPMVESGKCPANRQIGLSGRTVRPKLIITCGISGAVQFAAGMKGADTIVAINTDKSAPIFNIAHYGIVGDLCEIVPKLIEKLGR